MWVLRRSAAIPRTFTARFDSLAHSPSSASKILLSGPATVPDPLPGFKKAVIIYGVYLGFEYAYRFMNAPPRRSQLQHH
ncbi:expressed unknown protein [Seminavis robusta]|uniref:Uncharacterized protein n=1 Tax=Seminavis robusta TaxID=568900 RepID=A0A9N8DNY9_9STRA|nr:expressed unknown protein [Seminavis robusta]|eukprot:Sro245_g097320.1 n/a (79) ;mRNA; f:23633-24188